MSARDRFLDLVARFGVTNLITPTPASNPTVKGKLLAGAYNTGVWINLPLKTLRSYAGEVPEAEELNLIVYQRYIDNEELFSIAGDAVDPLGFYDFYEADRRTMTVAVIERLLSGETLRFEEVVWSNSDGQKAYNKDFWIEIALDK